MYLLQGQRLVWREGGYAVYEDVAEVRAAGFGSTSAPPTRPHSQFLFSLYVFWRLPCVLLPHMLLSSNSSLFACLFPQIPPFIFGLLSLLFFVSPFRS